MKTIGAYVVYYAVFFAFLVVGVFYQNFAVLLPGLAIGVLTLSLVEVWLNLTRQIKKLENVGTTFASPEGAPERIESQDQDVR